MLVGGLDYRSVRSTTNYFHHNSVFQKAQGSLQNGDKMIVIRDQVYFFTPANFSSGPFSTCGGPEAKTVPVHSHRILRNWKVFEIILGKVQTGLSYEVMLRSISK